MTRRALVLAALLAAVAAVSAQEAKPEKKVGESTEPLPLDELKAKLGCSDEQTKKIDAIETALEEAKKAAWTAFADSEKKADEERVAAHKKVDDDREAKKTARTRELNETVRARVLKARDEVRALLTDAQKEKYDELLAQSERHVFQARVGGRRNLVVRGGGSSDWEAIKAHLYKSAEEQLKLPEAEKAATLTLVAKLVEARVALWKHEDAVALETAELLKKYEKLEDAESARTLGAKLADRHDEGVAARERVERAAKDVRGALQVFNQARLVSLGLLEP
jgi:hypothetical protein